ncbi:MAG: SRPBCC family protein [Pseudomonadota bacterium]
MATALLIVLFIIIALLVFTSFKPSTFRVERLVNIQASPEKIFPVINDLHQHLNWSAWEKIDPNMRRIFSGPPSGVGAIYEWNGNRQIGQGRIEILESIPSSRIIMKIDFIQPFKATNTLEYTLKAQSNSTTVTHAMFGDSPYIANLMCLFFDREKMVGGKFEESLNALKVICESK